MIFALSAKELRRAEVIMKTGDKAQFSKTASLSLICVHGSASVLTITGAVAGVVFVRQDWTGSEFVVDESDIEVMAPDDAAIQGAIYQAHIERVRERRLSKK